jgi:hypothetical protein
VLDDRVGRYRALCLLGAQTDAIVSNEEAGRYLEEAGRIEDAAWSPRLRLRRQVALEWWHDVGGRARESRDAGLMHVALRAKPAAASSRSARCRTSPTPNMCRVHGPGDHLSRVDCAAAPAGRAASHTYANIVPALLERDDYEAAADALRAGRESFVRLLGTAFTMLPYLPALAMRRAEHRLAAQLLGCADRAYAGSGRIMHPPERRAHDKLLTDLQAILRERSLQRCCEGAT